MSPRRPKMSPRKRQEGQNEASDGLKQLKINKILGLNALEPLKAREIQAFSARLGAPKSTPNNRWF